ncbi:hypothetical protein ACK6G2_001361 [Escherichia coli]|nr:hypothetical protein [Escherichia coli]EIK0679747.1 hypothetical protein [Escherichia coli]HBE6407694.1 hypothetical protein [Escherichia coli]
MKRNDIILHYRGLN